MASVNRHLLQLRARSLDSSYASATRYMSLLQRMNAVGSKGYNFCRVKEGNSSILGEHAGSYTVMIMSYLILPDITISFIHNSTYYDADRTDKISFALAASALENKDTVLLR